MLYNPHWEAKADPYSLANLITWLEKQPPAWRYNLANPSLCLLGQFASAQGEHNPWKISIRLGETERFGQIAFKTPWTYGAALERARASLGY